MSEGDSTTAATGPSDRRLRWTASAIASLVTIVVFLSCRDLPFLAWDDDALLLVHTQWRGFGADELGWMFSTRLLGHFQPVTWMSYALDHALWGMDAGAFHTTNVVLHATAAGLLAWCSWTLLAMAVPALAGTPRLRAGSAAFAALLWSVHPLRVESVAWVTERRDVLSGALLLGSLVLWLRYARREEPESPVRRGAYAGSLVCFVLALLAKASSMGWPIVLLLLDIFPLRRCEGGLRLREKLPFAGASAVVAAIAWFGQSASGAFDAATLGVLDRIVLAGHAVSFYVLRTLLPFDLRAHYARANEFDPFDTTLLIGCVAAVVLTVLAWGVRRKRPALATTWFAYLTLLAPVSGLVPLASLLVAERYTYLPCAGFSLLVVGGVAGAVLRRRVPSAAAVSAAVVVTALLGFGSSQLCDTWRSVDALFGRVVRLEPTNWLAHGQLGRSASLQGRLETAEAHYRESIRLGHDIAESRAHLAWIAQRRGDTETAAREADAAIALDRAEALAWTVKSALAEQAGDLDAAFAFLLESRSANPGHATTHHNLAVLLIRRGQPDEAREAFAEALRLDPSRVGSRLALARLLAADGDGEGAAREYRRILELAPTHEQARAELDALTLGGR